jgi:hypothetical protein
MKRLLFLTLLAHGSVSAAPNATLFFADEQKISGFPSHLQTGAAGEPPEIVWIAPSLNEPMLLKQAKMLEMRLDTPPLQLEGGGHYAQLTLNNGDTVRGELALLDDASVTVLTPFAGELKFRRDMVGNLRIIQRPTLLYSGPKEGDWKLNPAEGGWSLQGNSLVSSGQGTASVDIKYPERFRLGVDLEWKTGLRFHILFLCNEENGEAGGGYDLFFQEHYVYLRKREGTGIRGGGAFIGPTASLSEFNDKEKLRLELLVDTRTGFMSLLLDGRTMQEWTDPTPPAADNAHRLQFSTDDGQQLRVSRISMSPWDGNIEALATENSAPKAAEEGGNIQQIVLRNGDIVQAETLKVTSGSLEAKTVHGAIKIPVERMRTLTFKKPSGNAPTPKKMLGDVRAWFPEGGRMTFRLDDLKEGKITGYSQQFGTAEFDLSAFERIEMNIGNLELEQERPKIGW